MATDINNEILGIILISAFIDFIVKPMAHFMKETELMRYLQAPVSRSDRTGDSDC